MKHDVRAYLDLKVVDGSLCVNNFGVYQLLSLIIERHSAILAYLDGREVFLKRGCFGPSGWSKATLNDVRLRVAY